MAKTRTASRKKRLLEELAKTPVVQVACARAGVSRSQYYKWRAASDDFEDAADFAQAQGEDLINDLAESKLIEAIGDRNMSAIRYWLSRHHHRYIGKPFSPLPFKRPWIRMSRLRHLW